MYRSSGDEPDCRGRRRSLFLHILWVERPILLQEINVRLCFRLLCMRVEPRPFAILSMPCPQISVCTSLTIPRPADYTLGMENVDATANPSVWQSDTISSSLFDNVAAQFNSLRGSQGRCEGLDTNYIPEGLRKAIKFRISYLSTYYWPTKAVSGLVNLLVHNLSKASALRDPRSVLSTSVFELSERT
jgi:hypothetical protein